MKLNILLIAVFALGTQAQPLEPQNAIQEKLLEALEGAKTALNNSITLAEDEVDKVFDALPGRIDELLNDTSDRITKGLQPLIDRINEAEDKAREEGKDVSSCDDTKEELLELAPAIIEDVRVKLEDLLENTRVNVTSDLEEARNLTQVLDEIEEAVRGCDNLSCLGDLLKQILQAAAELPVKVGGIARKAIATALQAAGTAAKIAGEETKKGLEEGRELANSTIECVKNLTGNGDDNGSDEDGGSDETEAPEAIVPENIIQDELVAALEVAKAALNASIDIAEDRVNKVMDSLPEQLDKLLNSTSDRITKGLQPLIDRIEEAEEKAREEGKDTSSCDDTKEQIQELAPEIIEDVKVQVEDLLENTRSNVTELLEQARNLTQVLDKIEEAVKSCNKLSCLGSLISQIIGATAELPIRVASIAGQAVKTALEAAAQATQIALAETKDGLERGRELANATLECVKQLTGDGDDSGSDESGNSTETTESSFRVKYPVRFVM